MARHEAGHCAMAVWVQRPVADVWRETGSTLPGETLGHARIPVLGQVGVDQLMIALAGYMVEGDPGWPPAFEQARTEGLEALGKVIELAGIDSSAYDRTVELTRRLIADHDFERLVDTISRALRMCPRLDEQAIRDLSEAAAIPYPEFEGATA